MRIIWRSTLSAALILMPLFAAVETGRTQELPKTEEQRKTQEQSKIKKQRIPFDRRGPRLQRGRVNAPPLGTSGVPSPRDHAVLRGIVKSASGECLKNAHVTLVNLSTEEKTETQTDELGRFQFSELFHGRYKLEVTTEKGETASDEVSVGIPEKSLRLTPRPTVLGGTAYHTLVAKRGIKRDQ
jgi:hypothetical protein